MNKRNIQCSIIHEDETLFEGEIRSLFAKTTEGGIEILPGHTPLLAILEPCNIKITELDGSQPQKSSPIKAGILEVQPYQIHILAHGTPTL